MLAYQEVKTQLINFYPEYKSIDDIHNIVHNIVIPYFDLLACDLDEIINEINTKYNVQSESMDFIEVIFNPNLYQAMLLDLDKITDKYIHYLIVLIEFTKYEKYSEMNNRLHTILSNDKITNTILADGIRQASIERIENCKERIKNIYNDLIKNFSSFVLSKQAINMILESNNLVL